MFFEEFVEEANVVRRCIGTDSRQVVELIIIVAKGWDNDTVGEEFNH